MSLLSLPPLQSLPSSAYGSRSSRDTSSPSLRLIRRARRVIFLLKKYESNIGTVSGYHRVGIVTKFENLVVAVIVSAVIFATAILLVSAVVLFALVIAAILVTAVIAATAAVLPVVTAVVVAVISNCVADIAVAALRFEVVRSNRLLLLLLF